MIRLPRPASPPKLRPWGLALLVGAALPGLASAQSAEPPFDEVPPSAAAPTPLELLQARVEHAEATQAALRDELRRLEAREHPEPPVVAGFSAGTFFLRSRDGAFRISPSLRLQVDGYAFAPAFVAPGQPRATLLLRRARPELFGALFDERVAFMLGGELADGPGRGAATDAFIQYNPSPWARFQVGQFDLPFTLENRTSDRYIEFLERSFIVRNLGTASKEPGVMVFGGPADHAFYYSVGLFTGDGINQRNLDNHVDVVGRSFVRPFTATPALDRVQVGGSFAWGRRTRTNQPYLGGAGAPADGWLATASGWSFFRTAYAGADGRGTQIGVVPEGDVGRLAAEASVPVGAFAVRAEYLYLAEEVDENLLASGAPLRAGGQVTGHGAYLLLGYWLTGDPRMLPDAGVQGAPLFDATGAAPSRGRSVQLVGRVDHARVRYRAGADLGPHVLGASQAAGTYRFTDVALGVNVWWTRHLRLSFNYVLDHIDGGRVANLPAPDQTTLHELSLRAAIAL